MSSVATRWGLLLRAWGSRLQMKDRTHDDDNDDVWLFWGLVFGLNVRWQHSFVPSHFVWQAGAGLKDGQVDRLAGDTLTFLLMPLLGFKYPLKGMMYNKRALKCLRTETDLCYVFCKVVYLHYSKCLQQRSSPEKHERESGVTVQNVTKRNPKSHKHVFRS